MPATAKPPPQTKKRTRSTRKTREAEAVKEYENLIDTSTQEALLAAQTDDDLFVVDRGGSKNKKRKIQKAEISKKESGTISKTETILINRIKKNKNKNEAIVVKGKGKKEDNVFDLWGGDEVTKQPRATTRKSFKKIAGPGLSYNPAHEDHQEALAEVTKLNGVDCHSTLYTVLICFCIFLMTGCCSGHEAPGRNCSQR
jgi:type II secretory pathway pseudopilin PulG